MTCGIYCLRFNGTNKVYIGQSENIDTRYLQHIRKLLSQKHSSKLQLAYNTYGIPSVEVLCECSREELDIFELEAIDIFDAVDNGYNTLSSIAGRSSLTGELVYNAKYSNDKIIEVFKLLLSDKSLTAVEIAEITGVSAFVIQTVSAGTNHKWLQQVYPIEYAELLNIKGDRNKYSKSAKARGIIYPSIVSPKGQIYCIDNVRAFAKTHGLQHSNLLSVLSRKYKQHKGWRLAEQD